MSLINEYDRLCSEKEDMERELITAQEEGDADAVDRLTEYLEDLEEEIEGVEASMSDMEVEE